MDTREGMRHGQDESDPRYHAENIQRMPHDVMRHAREDVGKVHDPKAQALYETTAEVWRAGNGLPALS